MYAAGALNAHNPWFFAMPELSRYLQRVSFALRLGEPANDVAVLLPNDDVWASFSAAFHTPSSPTSPGGFDESGSNVSIDESMDKFLGKQVIAQVLDAGFNLDFIDADAIDSVGIPYRVLILPAIDRLPVATLEKIVTFARRGGTVIATRRTPATAPGLMQFRQDSARLKDLSRALFQGGIPSAHFIADESALGAALKSVATPDMKLSPPAPAVGFIHRKLPEGDLYFVANTANEPQHVQAQFRDTARHAETWNAFTGQVTGLPGNQSLELDLEPYESRLIFFSDGAASAASLPERQESVSLDLSRQWKLAFADTGLSVDMDRLSSWSENQRTRFYSGLAAYEKNFNLPADPEAQAARYFIDFGPGSRVVVPSPARAPNMRAYLEGPIREAAQVYVNGNLAGVVWHPPYRIDVTEFVRPGDNSLRIVVGNTAINALAGQPLPDYRLLWARYGMRFVPQGMEDLHPVPSGLLGPVTLIESSVVK